MSRADFRTALLTSGAIMLSGIAMLLAGEAFLAGWGWWKRVASLLIVVGALAELLAVWRFTKHR